MKPLPKKKIEFVETDGGRRRTFIFNNDVTIDQLLRIYFRRKIFREDLINNLHNKICLLFNGQKLNLGNNTSIEIFFKSCKNPKVVLINPYNLINFEEADFFGELIGKLESFLYANIISDEIPEKVEIITIKFNKKGKIIDIKMRNDNMVAELLDEYFIKTNIKEGKFIFNGNTLSPYDTNTLFEKGLKNNSEIFVS